MELRQMRYAVMIAQHGNFRHAAEHLYISQSALSQQIKKLEEELGEMLFERHSSGVSLTEPGERFVKKAQGVLERAEEAKSAVKPDEDALSGQLSIGWVPTINSNFFGSLTQDIRTNNPDVSLKINEGQPEYLINQLNLGHVDHLVLTGPVDQSEFAIQKLGTESFKLAIPHTWKFTNPPKENPDQLSDRPFLALQEGHSYRKQSFVFRDDNEIEPDLTYEGNCYHKLIKLVETGAGYTFIPELFGEASEDHAIRLHNVTDPPSRKIFLVRRESRHRSSLDDWFIEKTRKWFDDALNSDSQ